MRTSKPPGCDTLVLAVKASAIALALTARTVVSLALVDHFEEAAGPLLDRVGDHLLWRAFLHDHALVEEDHPELPVLANGDIVEPEQAFDMLRETGAAGVMIGRGAMGNPWLFRQILELAAGKTPARPSPAERLTTIDRHIALMRECFEDDAVLASNLKKYVAAYSKGLPGSAAFRQQALESTELDALLAQTRRYFGSEPEPPHARA